MYPKRHPSTNKKTLTLSATKPLTTLVQPWPDFDAHLVVVGLAFLDGMKTTVDIDKLAKGAVA